MAEIQYIGLEDVDDFEREHIKQVVESQIEDVQHAIKEDFKLIVHVKVHSPKKQTDHRRDTKYSIVLRVECAGCFFDVEKSGFGTAEHITTEAFNSLITEINHKLKKN